MKTWLRDSIRYCLRILLASLAITFIWNGLAHFHDWPRIYFVDSLTACAIVGVLADLWWSAKHEHEHEPDLEIYNICGFCNRSNTCQIGKKVNKNGLAVMDCPQWEEPHEPDVP